MPKILLSAHKDVVFHPYKFSYNKGVFTGLLDNAIGVLVVNSLFIEDPNLALLEKEGELEVFFGDSEEWGTITEMPKLEKNDIAIVVDVASGSQYKGVDISLENISGFTKPFIKEKKDCLEWEGFKLKTKFYNGNKDDEDEGWYWKKQGNKVISFIIPIEGESWHQDNCTISIEKVVKAKQILKRLLNYLL